jgi:hypothetical protein
VSVVGPYCKDNGNRKKELSIIAAEAWVVALRLIGQIFRNVDLDKLGKSQLYH